MLAFPGTPWAADSAPRYVDPAIVREAAREIDVPERGAVFGPRAAFGSTADRAFASAIAASARPDCRVAYAGLMLLAVPVLIDDALTGGGCRW